MLYVYTSSVHQVMPSPWFLANKSLKLVADHWNFYLFGQLWSWSSLSRFTHVEVLASSLLLEKRVVFTCFYCVQVLWFIRLFDDLKWIEYHLVLPLNGTKSLGQIIWPLRVPSLPHFSHPHFWRSARTCHMPWRFVLWYLQLVHQRSIRP